ncbi:hypothetical protein GINT2_000927 [Glugoides intestinalis]
METFFLCLFFYLVLIQYKKIFHPLEILLFLLSFYKLICLENAPPLLISSLLTFSFPFSYESTLTLPILLGLDPLQYFKEIFEDSFQHKKAIAIVLLYFALFLNALSIAIKYNKKNLARKIFHFFFFFIFLPNNKLIFQLSHLLVYFSAVFCKTGQIIKLTPFLLKEKIKHADTFSFFFLVYTLTYSHLVLYEAEYARLCISICILDSFASITGNILKKKGKSIEGLLVGIFSAYMCELILYKSANLFYHILIGIVEFICPINDNITITFCSIIYQTSIRNYTKLIPSPVL